MTDISELYSNIEDLTRRNMDNILQELINYGLEDDNNINLLPNGVLVYFDTYGGYTDVKLYQNDEFVCNAYDGKREIDGDYQYSFCRLPYGTYRLYATEKNTGDKYYYDDIEIAEWITEADPVTLIDENGNEYQCYQFAVYSDSWNIVQE